ncbi:MAG: AEC family transporter [Omnitrophica WOR_2 bacterium]
MSELPGLFANNLLPILLASAAGYPLGKWLKVNPRSFSQIILYVFTPCLVFIQLIDAHLESGEILRMVAFALLTTILIGLISLVSGIALKLEKQLIIALLITGMFTNCGNFGLPLVQFAFGDDALAHATLFFITNLVMVNTVGVVIASMGAATLKDSLLGLLKLPLTYALVLAILFIQMGWQIPFPVDRTLRLLSQAAIPCMMILMGIQLQGAVWNGNLRALAAANVVRLLVAPILAIGLSLLVGLQGPARQAGVVESSMPSAILATVLATEYNAAPEFVTTAVFISTLLSPLTLTPLLAYLK